MTVKKQKNGTLYRITYLPDGREYYGSTTMPDINKRLKQHLSGKGGKYIYNLIQNGSISSDFIIEALMIADYGFCCEMEMLMKKSNHTKFPNGLNGEYGKNIIRTVEGQMKVSFAVSKSKTGRRKETDSGIQSQAEKLQMMTGDARSDKQKAWDRRLSDYNKSIGKRPPHIVVKGSKMMNNGQDQKWIAPNVIESYLRDGWLFGECKKRPPMSDETKQKFRKPKSEETKKKMSAAKKGVVLGPAKMVQCEICGNSYGNTGITNHIKACRKNHETKS